MLSAQLYMFSVVSSLIWIIVPTQLEGTTDFTENESNSTTWTDDGSNTIILDDNGRDNNILMDDESTVLTDNGLDTTTPADNGANNSIFMDESNVTVLTDDGLDITTPANNGANNSIFMEDESDVTVLTDDGLDTYLLTEDEFNTTAVNAMSNTTVLMVDIGLNTSILLGNDSESTVLTDDVSTNTTVSEEIEYSTTSASPVSSQSSVNTTVLMADIGLNTSILLGNDSESTVLTGDVSTNSTVSEEIEYSTTSASPVSSQSSVSKADDIVDCAKYATQSTVKPAVQLKDEPLCTESGSILDQLTRFIGYQFHKHQCGNSNSTAKFTEILYCSMLNTHNMCMQPFADELHNVNTETVPEISTVRNIIEGLCSMNRFIAKDCLFKRLKYVTRCVKTEVDSILSFQNKKWAYGAIDQCRHLEVKVMCMWENILPCNEKTAGSMAGLIGQHLRSETCTLSGVKHVLPFTWFQFLAIMCTLLLIIMENT
ncbi:hypothetical protein BsWGS_01509 [Bradybaena similaris]